MSVPFVSSGDTLTLMLDGEAAVIRKDHPSYAKVCNALQDGTAEELRALIAGNQRPVDIAAASNNRCFVQDGKVYLDGEEVHNVVADRIAEFAQEGLPFDRLLKFLERMSENPSYRAQTEGYTFLENKGLPLTEDGCFLAYKAVTSDYRDKFTGKIDNSVGQTVKMKRAKVDDNCEKHCSKGLHAGALDYVYWYGRGDDRIIIVKIDPANIVSVPTDCQCQKIRVCEYTVVQDFTGELKRPLYDANADSAIGDDPQEWDGEWGQYADNRHNDEEYDDYFEEDDVVSCCGDCDCGEEHEEDIREEDVAPEKRGLWAIFGWFN